MLRFRRLTALGFTIALAAAMAVPGWAQAPQPSRPAAVPTRPAAPAATLTPAPAATTAPSTAASGSRIDVNSATEAQLDSLPGIGPVRAKAIVAGRPYTDTQDLTKKKVLTAGVMAGIKDRIALANINTSSASDLQRTLPGVGDVRAKAIVAGRPYAAPVDLVTKKVLPQGVFDGVKDLVAY